MLDWKFFPHIFDNIYEYLDGQGLDAIRLTCAALRARAETDLWDKSHCHIVSSMSPPPALSLDLRLSSLLRLSCIPPCTTVRFRTPMRTAIK